MYRYILAFAFLGCTPKTQGAVTPAAKAETAYGTEILNCTNKSNSKLESKACECSADIRWKVAAPNACDQFEEMKRKVQK